MSWLDEMPDAPPTTEDAMQTAMQIVAMAEQCLDDPARADAALDEWLGGDGPLARLRMHVLATTGTCIASAVARKHLQLRDGELWMMQTLPGATPDRARTTVMRAFVRHLGGEDQTAAGIIQAALDAGGDRALGEIAGEVLCLLVHTLRAERDGLWATLARHHADPPPARHPKRRPRTRAGRRGRRRG